MQLQLVQATLWSALSPGLVPHSNYPYIRSDPIRTVGTAENTLITQIHCGNYLDSMEKLLEIVGTFS